MLKRIRNDWREYCWHCEMAGDKPTFREYLWMNCQQLRWLAGQLICRFRGHDWVDESYGGPDSGCMAGYCKRCGESFHHTLY